MEIGLNNYNYNNNNRTSDFGPPFDLWSLFITTAATSATTASTSTTTTTTTTTRTIKSSHDVAAIKQAATSAATIHRFIRSFSYFTDNADPSPLETSSSTTAANTILRDCFNFSLLENGFGNPVGQTGHHHHHHLGGHRPLTTISMSSSSSASSASSTITTTESFDYFYLNELLKEKFNDATVIISVIILVLINIIVIFGNILVILSVFVSTKLRTVTNFFIVSLAVADFLVGIAVLPYSLTFEILDTWIFGEVWCQGWLVIDVWMCTASILNLCAISVDRYMAVTRPVRYRSLMTAKRAKFIIAGVWIISFIICFPPLLVGKQEPFSRSSLTTTTTTMATATTTATTIKDSMAPITTTATTTTTTAAEDVLAYQQFRRKSSSTSSSTSPLSSNNNEDDSGGGGGEDDDDNNEEDEDDDGRFIYHDDHDPQVSSIIPGRIVSSSSFDDNNRKAMKTTDDDVVDVVVDVDADDHHDGDDHNNTNDGGDYDPDLNPNYERMNQSSSSSNDATADDAAAGSTPTSSSTYYKQCKPQPVQCALFRNKSYVIYSAFGSFFIPMFVMIFFYWRIYLVAIRTSRALKRGYRITKTSNNDDNNQQERLTLRIHRGYATEENTATAAAVIQEKRPSIDNDNVHQQQQKHYRSSWATTFHRSSNQTETAIVDHHHQSQPPPTTTTMGGGGGGGSDKLLQIPGKISAGTGQAGIAGITGHTGHVERNCRRNSSGYQSNMSLPFSASSSREGSARGSKTNLPVRPSKRASKYQAKRFHAETKAAKTVGIIVGGFIVCWLPFFTVYLTRAFCEDCISELLFSIFFWLGYCNSMINPCIYGLFSKDFRRAFKNIICRCRLREETSVSSLIRQIHMPTFFEDMPEEMARQESQDY